MIDLKYSDDCRRALARADLCAHLYNHSQIVGMHMLLGIVQDEDNVISMAISSILAKRGRKLEDLEWGIEEVLRECLRSWIMPGVIPYSGEANEIIDFAKSKAEAGGTDFVDTYHLMLGIYRVGGSAASMLEGTNITKKKIMRYVLGLTAQHNV